MNRRNRLKITGVVAMMLIMSACAGKQIPEPVAVEPEAVKGTSTEGSLWPGENPRNMLFSDNKAGSVGDIITVHLVEETIATNKAATKTGRAQTNGFSMDTGSGTPTAFDFGGGQTFNGSGNTSRSERLTSTISAMVVEVYSNGNMKIEGRRKLKINDEDQYVMVAGIVRQEDVDFNNAILSTKIANAEITYDGIGSLDKTQRAGFLGRALDKIWPF